MVPYWIIFAYFGLGTLAERRQKVDRRWFLILGLVLIALVAGFRYHVGGDWGSYNLIYIATANDPFTSAIALTDPGYQIVGWLSAQTGAGIWLLNLICAAIFCWGLARFVAIQPLPWLAVLVAVPYLVIVVAMGYTRQAVAIGLIMAGIASMVRTGSPRRFIVYLAIATLFHKTAIVALPLVLIGATRNRFIFAAVAVLLGFVLYEYFLSSSIDLLKHNYLDVRYASQGAGVRVAMTVVTGVIAILFGRKMGFSEIERKIWRNFAYASIILLIALFTVSSSTVVDRLGLYTFPLQVAVLSRVPILVNNDMAGKLAVIAFSFLVLFVWLNYATNAALWIPYRIYPFHVFST